MFSHGCYVRELLFVSMCCFPFTIPLSTALAQSESPVTIDSLVKGIRAREERVRSATFKWTEKRFDGKGSWSRTGLPFANILEGQPIPADDLTYQSKRTFSFDGEKTRHFVTENTPDFSGEFFETENVTTFDGKFCRSLDAPNRQRTFHSGR